MTSSAPSARARLFHHLSASPQRVALSMDGVELTFGQLHARAHRYATGLLAQGVRPGDRVAVWLETSPDVVVALLGHYMAGAVHVPINTRYGQRELDHILADSAPRMVLVDAHRDDRLQMLALSATPCQVLTIDRARPFEDTWASQTPHTRPLPAREDEDTALFIYTSGTTGPSKGVELPYRAIAQGIGALTALWRWTPEDVLALSLPLFHVHGLCLGIHGVLLTGCSALLSRFSPEGVYDAFERQGATIFMGVPTMYTRLVRALEAHPEWARALGQARLFTSGSGALSAQTFERFEALTGHRILERYGMSETLLTISNPYCPEARRPGTIGHPIAGVQMRILDDNLHPTDGREPGQLAVRGDTMMTGYWGLPQKTAASFHEGWFLTGDAVRLDEEGYVVHVGRMSVDILKRGGYKISAREIEDALATLPGLEEVAVFGVADEEWGQVIHAALVPTSDAPARDATAWLALCASHLQGTLAPFKFPTQVHLLDALPRNALGKVQKHRLVASIDI